MPMNADSFRLVGEAAFSWRADKRATTEQLGKFEERAGRWIATYRWSPSATTSPRAAWRRRRS